MKPLRINVQIIADLENSRFTWKLWGRGMKVTTKHSYRLVEAAIKAARRVIKQLNVETGKWEYYEPETNYKQPLRIGR